MSSVGNASKLLTFELDELCAVSFAAKDSSLSFGCAVNVGLRDNQDLTAVSSCKK